jgi:hypothetical protein
LIILFSDISKSIFFILLKFFKIKHFFQEQCPSDNINKTMNTTINSLEESEVTLTKPDRTIPPIQIPPILEEKRNQRRQQLNEILQKIRPENSTSPLTTIHHSNSNGLAKKDVSKILKFIIEIIFIF